MGEPIAAQKAPYQANIEAGKTYAWCACGRSAKQPFCDGSHKDTGFQPVAYEATKDGPVFFCGCKSSQRRPVCDGTHNSL